MHRNIDVRLLVRVGAEEFAPRDTGNREWQIIDQNRLPRSVRRSAETALAQGIADNRNRRRARAVVIRPDQAANGRLGSEAAKIAAGHIFGIGDIGLRTEGQVELAGALVSENAREYRIALLEQLECRIRESPTDVPAFGIVIVIVVTIRAV